MSTGSDKMEAVEYRGYNGTISADNRTLTITHSGLPAKMAGLVCDQPRVIPLGAISGVAFKEASRLVNGSLTLGLGGADAVDMGSQAPGDPNAVVFRHKDNAVFKSLYAWLLRIVQMNRDADIDYAAVLEEARRPEAAQAEIDPSTPATRGQAEQAASSEADRKPGMFARRREARRLSEEGRDEFEAIALAAAMGDTSAIGALPAAIERARSLYRPKELERRLWGTMATAVRHVIDDDILSAEEEEHLERLGILLGTPVAQIQEVNQPLFEELVIAGINDGRFPSLPDPSIMLKRGETGYGSFSASLMKDQAIREFRAGSSSVSIPLGHGVRYRVGGVRGRSVVVGTELVVQDAGTLTVTNQRTVFTGRAKTLEFRNDKLVGLEQFTDGLRLSVSNRQSASLFRVKMPSVAAALISASAARNT